MTETWRRSTQVNLGRTGSAFRQAVETVMLPGSFVRITLSIRQARPAGPCSSSSEGLSRPSSQRQRDFLVRGPALAHHLRARPLARHQLFLVGRVLVNRPLLGLSHQRLLGLRARAFMAVARADVEMILFGWLKELMTRRAQRGQCCLRQVAVGRGRGSCLLAIIWGQDCPRIGAPSRCHPRHRVPQSRVQRRGSPTVESGGGTQHADGEKSHRVLRSIGAVVSSEGRFLPVLVILRALRTVPRCASNP